MEYLNSGIDDSVYHCKGNVCLQVHRADSIFGAHFHIIARDKNELFEYFYDGIKCFEVRHNDKEITIIEPYKFENDKYYPAKATMALAPFVELLIDTNIKATLLKNCPRVCLDSNEFSYLINLDYPEDEFGIIMITLIKINKHSYNIEKIHNKSSLNGVSYSNSYTIDSLIFTEFSDEENYRLKNINSDYELKEYNDTENETEFSDLIGKEAKNFKYNSFNNDTIILSEFRGKMVLLDFWESWCGHCIESIPLLQKLADEYHDDLIVIAITTENAPQIRKIIKANNISYVNIHAEKQILSDYSIKARPAYVLIDANGIIVEHTAGDLERISLAIKLKKLRRY